MQKLNLTLPTPAGNLALDEALLSACEAGEISEGVLRLWEPEQYFVVLGRSSDPKLEVNLAACRQDKIPVLRRVSGGGTILAGPGCLMYSVVLSYADYPELQSIDCAHHFVLQRLTECLTPLVPGIHIVGTSDLAIDSADSLTRKFSGNALRAKRTHLLYHGTLLYDFDLDRLSQLLATPIREPAYRSSRNHREFVTNLPLSRAQLISSLTTGWKAPETLFSWPQEHTQEIHQEKYRNDPRWVISD